MVQPVILDREQLRSILSLYHLDNLEDFGGVSRSGFDTSYWVRVDGKKYILRITSQKRVQDMVYEKELLFHLQEAGLPVPLLVENVAKGTFLPWSTRGRYVSLFEEMAGRQLGVFEVRAQHTKEIGAFIARVHERCAKFGKQRSNPFGIKVLQRQLNTLIGGLEKRRLAKRLAPDVELLSDELMRHSASHYMLPKGVVHGDLFIENARFLHGQLCGVGGFERCATELLVWDLAVLLCTWCWQPAVEQSGGPSGSFAPARVRGLLDGYQTVRSLSEAELDALPELCRLVACRFAITRMVDFELRKRSKSFAYRDYLHFIARLQSLRESGAEHLLEAL